MYSYGWREYMPDIGRWNGIDQLAENFLSTSTYAYVANNPVSYADVDGRWFDQDGHIIDTSGQTYGFLGASFKPKHASNFLGVNPGDGGGGSYTPFGQTQAYADLMDAFHAGGTGGLINNNGILSWWTDFAGAKYGQYNMLKINTNSWLSNIESFFENNFVFKAELSGSTGVQVGAKLGGPLQANAEAGILSTDIGKMGWDISKGFYAKYGDGKGHNFIAGGVKLLSKKLSVGGKADYVTNDPIPTAGDLLKYYPNNGHLEWGGNIGPGKSHLSPQKGSDADILNIGLKSKLRGSNKESCNFCADIGAGFKALIGVDIKFIVGFK